MQAIHDASRINRQWVSIADQLVVSGSNFVTQFFIARHLGPNEFGQFSLLFLTTLFLSNIHRAYFTQPYNILAIDLNHKYIAKYRGELLFLQIPWVLIGALVIAVVGMTLELNWSPILSAVVFFGMFQIHELARRTALTSNSLHTVLRNDFLTFGLQIILIILAPTFKLNSDANYFQLMSFSFGLSIILWFFSGLSVAWPDVKDLTSKIYGHWEFSKWLVYAVFVTWGASQIYPFMLGKYGVAIIGSYVAARNIANISNVPIQAINGYFPSIMAKYIAKGDSTGLRLLNRRLDLLLLGFAILMVLIALLFGSKIVLFIYGDKYVDASNILNVLIFGASISVLNVRQNSLLLALRATTSIFKGNLVATIFSVTIGYAIAINFGAIGAAFSASVALAINFGIQLYFCHRISSTTLNLLNKNR